MPGLERVVTGDFRQNGGGGNRKTSCVAMDQGGLRQRHFDRDGVDKQTVAGWRQPFHGAPHGEPRGLQDIQTVDFENIGSGDRPGSGALTDARRQGLAAIRLQRLAIVQAANWVLRIEHNGGGENRSEQRSPAGFIHAGDGAKSGLAPGSFVAAGGHRKDWKLSQKGKARREILCELCELCERACYSRSRSRAALPFNPRR